MKREEAIEIVHKNYPHVGFSGSEFETALRELIPELAESEDEKIRKELIEQVEYIIPDKEECDNDGRVLPAYHKRIERYRAYLEKQKEQKSRIDACGFPLREEGESACSYLERCLAPDMRNIWYEACSEIKEKQKEQKPNIELIQRSWYMEGYHDREFSREPKWIIKTGEGGPKYEKNEKYGQPLVQKHELCDMGRWDEESYNNGIHHVLHNPEAYGLTKQKPAEWSLTDATFIEEIDETLFMAETGRNEVVKNQIERERNWLKSLPERFNLEPKQEWSEEDEKVYEYLKSGFEYATNNPQLLASRLWGGSDVTIQDYKNFVDKLKSILPYPHWKPSEEQMASLAWWRHYSGNLESLYNELSEL